jgi:hypothetical protein
MARMAAASRAWCRGMREIIHCPGGSPTRLTSITLSPRPASLKRGPIRGQIWICAVVRPFPGLFTVCAHSSDDADGGARRRK